MRVFELIKLLQQYDPDTHVVRIDEQEPELCNARGLAKEDLRPCTIKHLHPDRPPKFVAGEPNAISLGQRTPEVWVPPKY